MLIIYLNNLIEQLQVNHTESVANVSNCQKCGESNEIELYECWIIENEKNETKTEAKTWQKRTKKYTILPLNHWMASKKTPQNSMAKRTEQKKKYFFFFNVAPIAACIRNAVICKRSN